MPKEKKTRSQQDAVPVAEKAQEGEMQPAAARALSPLEAVDALLDTLFRRGGWRPFQRDWPAWFDLEAKTPRVDVIDRESEIVVRAEAPGVDKDKLEVSLTGAAITIKGAVSHEDKEEKGDYHRIEMMRGSFARTVTLPAEVDGSRAKASFKNGVVEVILPKAPAAKRRSIPVD